MRLEDLQKIMREYFVSLVQKQTGGNRSRFATITGIPKPDVVNLVSGKSGRHVTVEMLIKISQHTDKGMPSLSGIFLDLMLMVRQAETQGIDSVVKPIGGPAILVETKNHHRALVSSDEPELAEFLTSEAAKADSESAAPRKPPTQGSSRRPRPRR